VGDHHEERSDTDWLRIQIVEAIEGLGDRLVEAIDHRDADWISLPCDVRVTLAKKLCEGTSEKVGPR
jgi:hypothetical protein